jgi:hypothetical protein
MPRYRVMVRSTAERFVPFMLAEGVSEVARSPRGFFYQWGKMGARVWAHPDPKFGQRWEDRRDNFVARHMEQFSRHPTLRRFLALVAWAYTPFDSKRTHRLLAALERDDNETVRAVLSGSRSRSK